MNRRYIVPALALALSVACAASLRAEEPRSNATTTASVPTSVKVKSVSFHVRNDSSTPIVLQVADQQITVQPGKTADLKAPVGTSITSVNATANVTSGSVITTVSKVLSGNTLAIS